MPSDYGDDSGEKLVDWLLRIGQDAGGAAMASSAQRLTEAFRNARGSVTNKELEAETQTPEQSWAKLNMRDFQELPEYESIRELIDERLNEASIEHAFHKDGVREFLVFEVQDAPEIDEVFATLEREADEALDEAKERLPVTKSREAERLAVKAEQAKAASAASKAAREQARQVERLEQRTR